MSNPVLGLSVELPTVLDSEKLFRFSVPDQSYLEAAPIKLEKLSGEGSGSALPDPNRNLPPLPLRRQENTDWFC